MKDMNGCPGSREMDISSEESNEDKGKTAEVSSQLDQWPIQLHLVSPNAPYYQEADVLLTADCVAYAVGDFHNSFLKDKSIAIACPKLDEGQEVYEKKIKTWLEDAEINTLNVLIMQVPCCSGLMRLAQSALNKSERKIPAKCTVVDFDGNVIEERWMEEG